MRVLYVTNTLHRGGAEAHLLQLATGLRARGGDCEVAFLRSAVGGGSIDLAPAFESAGVATHYLACDRAIDLRAGFRLRRLLRSGRWDLVHSHLPRADAAAAVCKWLDPALRWITTLHHTYDDAYSGAALVPWLAPMWRYADGVISVSDPVRDWAIRRLKLRADRVETIVHGVPDVTPAAQATTAPGRRIGSIGRYERRKNHETLIRAMVRILREFPDAHLEIAGHDPWGYGDHLRRLVRELRLDRHVTLSGFMSDAAAFFSGIDVFAFASRSEGFGIVVLEAMAAGKPVVVSDIAPLNRIITPGDSGLVAAVEDADAFADAIVSLFRDRATLRAMGERAQHRVAAEFSESVMVDRTLRYYRRVLGDGVNVAG